MSGQVTVRPAGPGDVDAVAAIHVAGYEEAYRGLVPDEVIDSRTLELRRRVWRERLEGVAPREFVVVAELDDEVAGFVSGRPATPEEDEDGGRVACWENLYLAPELIGSAAGFRVGLALHRETLRNASELGFSEAVAFPIEGNTRALRFFEAMGWRPDGGGREGDGVRQQRLRRSVP